MEDLLEEKHSQSIILDDFAHDVFRKDAIKKYKSVDVKSFADINQNIDLGRNILGVVDFTNGMDNSQQFLGNDNIPYIDVQIPPFDGKSCAEVWTSDHKVSYGSVGPIKFAVDGENMFASASIPQRPGVELAKLGEEVYDELFKLAVNLHYPYFYRMWNFVPDINLDDINELERYKSFCYGRATSFFKNTLISENVQFPAATGIGSEAGNISIYLLASSLPRYKHFENPRQVPAFNYPEQYGPQPPSFARATYYNRGDQESHIYVSGTASVVGHESVHIGDIENQCLTTFENIEILISEENLAKYGIKASVGLKQLDEIKVYIRQAKDYEIVKALCEKVFDTSKNINYFKADVCRADLLVEIEGVIKF